MSHAIDIIEPTDELIETLVRGLTGASRKAFEKLGYTDVGQGIKDDVKASSLAFVGLVDKEPAAVVCVQDLPDDFLQRKGYIWILFNEKLNAAPKAILRMSCYYMERLMQRFDKLVACIDMENETNIKYAKFLGFKDTKMTTMLKGYPFGIFIKEKY